MSKKDYEVGYKKPPVANRFKPGQSGNPAGRKPKQKRQPKTDIGKIAAEVMRKTVTVNDAEFNPLEVAIRTIVTKAMKGDLRAFKQMLELYERMPKEGPQTSGVLRITSTPEHLREIAKCINQAVYCGSKPKDHYTIDDLPKDMLERAIETLRQKKAEEDAEAEAASAG